MKTIKRKIVQKLADGKVKNYEIWLVSPKRFRRMKRESLISKTPAWCVASWTFVDSYGDDVINTLDIVYDDNDSIAEKAIYIIQSNEVRKFKIGIVTKLFKSVDGIWTMQREDMEEHFIDRFILYRLFKNKSECAKYSLSI